MRENEEKLFHITLPVYTTLGMSSNVAFHLSNLWDLRFINHRIRASSCM